MAPEFSAVLSSFYHVIPVPFHAFISSKILVSKDWPQFSEFYVLIPILLPKCHFHSFSFHVFCEMSPKDVFLSNINIWSVFSCETLAYICALCFEPTAAETAFVKILRSKSGWDLTLFHIVK